LQLRIGTDQSPAAYRGRDLESAHCRGDQFAAPCVPRVPPAWTIASARDPMDTHLFLRPMDVLDSQAFKKLDALNLPPLT
jgi:hypothetical protein